MEIPRFKRSTRVLGCALAVATLVQTAMTGLAESETVDSAGYSTSTVEFTVDNIAAFPSTCHPDGKTYTVRGTLTTPTGREGAQDASVDLYQHALAAGEDYWHIPATQDAQSAGQMSRLGHVERMAQRGRSSVTIDRLGYGASDQPDGNDICLSSDVSVNHQIVTKLKTGDYTEISADGPVRSFGTVSMVGHSIGGFIAEAEAALFDDVAQINLLNWNGFTFTPQELQRYPGAGARCIAGDTSSTEGFDLFEPDSSAFLDAATGGDYSPETRQAIQAGQNPTPCGTTLSIPSSVAALAPRLQDITVPVSMFSADGDRDLVMSPEQGLLYPNAASRSFWTQHNAGHYGALARSAPTLQEALAEQLP